METPRNFIIAELSICKLGSSSVLIIMHTLFIYLQLRHCDFVKIFYTLKFENFIRTLLLQTLALFHSLMVKSFDTLTDAK